MLTNLDAISLVIYSPVAIVENLCASSVVRVVILMDDVG
jgi:hypothetical protein